MLSVDMTGVEELILNDGLEQLILLGEVKKDCNIQANGKIVFFMMILCEFL